MVAFYSQEDQDIYEKNKFMPQSKYLLNAPTFNTPTVEEEKITETFGIPNTNAFTNSGGGGGGGSSYGLPGNFQQVVDARQRNLNKPIDTSTFMGKVKDFMNPQSAEDIRTSGYQDPRFQPGIIGTMMGKLDNYRNLPQADQAFIAENMGYTGPTIFGENNSGLGKDEFGINTRSLFGNYAQHSRDMADEEGDLAKQVADQIKRGLTNTIQMRKLAFHQKKQEKENTRIEEKTEEARSAKESEIVARKGQAYYDRAVETAGGRDPSQGNTVTGYGTSGLGRNPEDKMAKGGRVGYFFGGRAGFAEGGWSPGVGRDEKGYQSDHGSYTGGDNDNNPPPVFYEPPNKTNVLYDNTILGKVPTGLTKDMDIGRLSAIMNLNKTLEEEKLEGKMQYDSSIGPFNTTASYDTTTGPEFNASYNNNNLNANFNTNTGLSANYSKDIGPGTFTMGGDINPDGTYNTQAKYGITFANGGLASIL